MKPQALDGTIKGNKEAGYIKKNVSQGKARPIVKGGSKVTPISKQDGEIGSDPYHRES